MGGGGAWVPHHLGHYHGVGRISESGGASQKDPYGTSRFVVVGIVAVLLVAFLIAWIAF